MMKGTQNRIYSSALERFQRKTERRHKPETALCDIFDIINLLIHLRKIVREALLPYLPVYVVRVCIHTHTHMHRRTHKQP